ncbi:MAG TPA: DEAD/DEAH box helicase family protein [Kofleriaceae bacterium]|nr:DEAD/DEAH box helicase family protein [Kofleriaceae bacterium]
MKPGLYEQLITLGLTENLAGLDLEPDREDVGELAPQMLARHVFDLLFKALRNVPAEERSAKQRELANKVVALLASEVPAAGLDRDDEVADPVELLLALRDPAETRLGTGHIERPKLPLGQSDLLINGPRDLTIGHEIRSELASADAVDFIVSFVKWTGLRVIKPQLEEFARRQPGRLRVLTTTYMGATEAEALDALTELGAEVKVSYDARRTRLHAKAWLFHRDTGFSTGIVGSSNLSHAALLDGCEWNVRLSMVDNRTILEKFITTFDQYWSDIAFEPYDRARFTEAATYRDPARDQLAKAVQIRPFPHQAACLDQLANERAHGHSRNLVVAATGTGKTVVAALDYARLRKQLGGDPSLLFIAHREEILEQSVARYRAALGDGHFGELLVGARRPQRGRHVFASIQALHKDRLATLRPDAYDIIVIDEFHHAAADSYTAVLNHFTPKILLGLTATPERADGKSVLTWFDGRIAAELRLWDALDQGLVVPFQYFGVHDGTKLSTIAFNRGRYDVASLESLYTADHVRANAVLRAIHTTIRAPHQMRALGFCVSVKHAEFMAAFFNSKGLPSLSVDHETSDAARADALQQLRTGKVNVVFVRDLFNEGLDIPGIDTVLFLRPTESATIFLQQLGRGLRHEDGKACLTVLDFIGDAHRSFRFIDRFRALTRGTRAEVHRAIVDGFPRLPAGCDIQLDRESHEAVLANVRQSLSSNWRHLADDLRHAGDIPLAAFLAAADVEPEELYSNDSRTFTELRHQAGFRKEAPPQNELTRAIPRMTYVDDDIRLQRWAEWLAQDQPPAADATDPWMLMLFAALGFVRRPVSEMALAFDELWSMPDVRTEIVDLLRLLDDRPRRSTFEFPGLPFRLHASYSRDEISAGLLQTRQKKDKTSKTVGPPKLLRTQGGVFQCEDARADILYVELDKDPRHYTPTTLYDDRAITPTLFHWESQSRTRADSATGRLSRGGLSDRIGGGQTDRGYPQVAIAAT